MSEQTAEQPPIPPMQLGAVITEAFRAQTDYPGELGAFDEITQRALAMVEEPAARSSIILTAGLLRWGIWGERDAQAPDGLTATQEYGGTTVWPDEELLSEQLLSSATGLLGLCGLDDAMNALHENRTGIIASLLPDIHRSIANDPRIALIRQAANDSANASHPRLQGLTETTPQGRFRQLVDQYANEAETEIAARQNRQTADSEPLHHNRFGLAARKMFDEASGGERYLWPYYDEHSMADLLDVLYYDFNPAEKSFDEALEDAISELVDAYSLAVIPNGNNQEAFEIYAHLHQPRDIPESSNPNASVRHEGMDSLNALERAIGEVTIMPTGFNRVVIGTKGFTPLASPAKVLRFITGSNPAEPAPETPKEAGFHIAIDQSMLPPNCRPDIAGHDVLGASAGTFSNTYYFEERPDTPYRSANRVPLGADQRDAVVQGLEEAGLTQLSNAIALSETCTVQTLVELIKRTSVQADMDTPQSFIQLVRGHELADFYNYAKAGRFHNEGAAAAALLAHMVKRAFGADAHIGFAVGSLLKPGRPHELTDAEHIQVILTKDGEIYYLDPAS